MNSPDISFLIAKLKAEGISHPAVLAAITKTKRDQFVAPEYQEFAYSDSALPIACAQTISQPYIVARMTSLLLGDKNHLDHILEIGTGSGYQAAVLAHIANQVYTIERFQTLYETATTTLAKLNYTNITTILGDGSLGFKEQAPFDGIIVTACCQSISPHWLEQLKEGAHLVLPLQQDNQQYLYRITRRHNQFIEEQFDPVRFVPLVSGVDKNS